MKIKIKILIKIIKLVFSLVEKVLWVALKKAV